MPFRRIAIAGASQSPNGHSTGYAIAKKLLLERRERSRFDSVTILGRKKSSADKQASIDELVSLGAEYLPIEYGNVDETAQALKERKIDCVLSCLAVSDPKAIGESEVNLVKASAKAGVKRFFPSQYGPDDDNLPPERVWRISQRKSHVANLGQKLGMEVTKVVTGIFYEAIFTDNGVFHWSDDGKSTPKGIICGEERSGEVMAISIDDIANFVSAMLSASDTSPTANRAVRIIADRYRTGDEFALFEEVTGRTVERVRYPMGDPINDRGKFPQYPRLVAGNHYYVDPALSDNHLFPEVTPLTLREWLKKQVAETGSASLRFPGGGTRKARL
ncbi:NAD(P)-binding protein [Gonapodya prolifera JEL478]|uniref:NAD(P)-binding protein n=1 Tax=Gonapodya prolifera (strain JEL478) TaxID=1344416 RepID=A0A139ATR5_GONPJ|nr:NAD(P)-binding protein [Gonapodya prolifera JEL478]|eukprot:KXS19963.1 NAD(P)-binding protein [Gonapodya prolifera JEL478]